MTIVNKENDNCLLLQVLLRRTLEEDAYTLTAIIINKLPGFALFI